MAEMDKSRELYSKEGDNSSRFEGKTVPLEHTISQSGDWASLKLAYQDLIDQGVI